MLRSLSFHLYNQLKSSYYRLYLIYMCVCVNIYLYTHTHICICVYMYSFFYCFSSAGFPFFFFRSDTNKPFLFTLTEPDHQRAGGNLRYFEHLLSKQLKEMNQAYKPASEEPIQLGTYSRPKDHLPEREAYEALCRGEGLRMVRCRKSNDMLKRRDPWQRDKQNA